MPDICADPFHEHDNGLMRLHAELLGARFRFETASPELMRLVRWAYADLPRHRLCAAPRLTVRLALADRRAQPRRGEPEPIGMLSGADFLCGASPASSMTVISPRQRSALVMVARDMLKFSYHARYELIELAVFTLAARAQGLMPLHAACVGRDGCGLLLIGPSGAGKSTAVLHGALQGLEMVSEDSLFVAPRTLLATGVANFLHVRRESLRFLSQADARLVGDSPVIRRRSGVRKFELDLRQDRFRLAPAPVKVAGIVDLSPRKGTGKTLLAPLSSSELAARLVSSQPYAAGQSGWSMFIRNVRAVPAFELRRGAHPMEGVAALRGLLEKSVVRGRRSRRH